MCSAWALHQAGVSVKVLAAHFPPATTSNKAAAIWFPFHAGPEQKVMAWGRTTLDHYLEASSQPGSGVQLVELLQLEAVNEAQPPSWHGQVPQPYIRHAQPHELPPDYSSAYVLKVPFIDAPHYLATLANQLNNAGVALVQQQVGSLEALAQQADAVVNCTAWGRSSWPMTHTCTR